MSSIETLLEAAKYVDKVETTKDEGATRQPSSPVVSCESVNDAKMSVTNAGGVMKHWRKRAVAQSVMEQERSDNSHLKKTPNLKNKDESVGNEVTTDSHTSVNKVNFNTAQDIVTTTRSDPIIRNPDPNILNREYSKDTTQSLPTLYRVSSALNMPSQPDLSPRINNTSITNTCMATSSLSQSAPSDEKSELNSLAHLPTSSFKSFSSLVSNDISPSTRNVESGTIVTSSLKNDDGNTMFLGSQFQNNLPYTKQDVSSPAKHKSPLGAGTREAHNKLEKSRRAHLKECFILLRKVVPALGTKKVSNLVVLREALKYVQALKRKEEKQEQDLASLAQEKLEKVDKLNKLRQKLGNYVDQSQIDSMLRTVAQNAMLQNTALVDGDNNENGSEQPANDDNLPHSSTFLSQLIDGTPKKHSVASSMSTSIKPHSTDTNSTSAITSTCSVSSVGSHISSSVGSYSSVTRSVSTSRSYFLQHNTQNLRQIGANFNSDSICDKPYSFNVTPIANLSTRSHPTTVRLSQISANLPGTTLPQYETITATAHKIPSVKSFKGRSVSAGITIAGCPNPLKIVVKPVDSAKQQARVVKSSDGDNRAWQKQSTQRYRCTELVHRPRSSVTPPPPSRITPYFPRFSVGSGGSPPLTTILPNINDSDSLKGSEDQENELIASQSKFTIWRSKSDNLNIPPFHPTDYKKHNVPSRKRKLPVGSSVNISPVKTFVGNMPYSMKSGDGSGSETDSETETKTIGLKNPVKNESFSLPSSNTFKSLASLPSTILFPPTTSSMKPNRSVTQVCYSTLKSAKPTILPSSSFQSQHKQEQQISSIVSAITHQFQTTNHKSDNSYKDVRINTSVNKSPISNNAYQVLNPTFMNSTVTAQSVPGVVSGQMVLPADSRSTATVPYKSQKANMTFMPYPNPSNKTLSVPSIMQFSSAVNQSSLVTSTSVTSAQVPQVQYVIPVGYPGMVAANAGGTPMALPPTMGGFIPVMPQGQGWGYMMPQNMVPSLQTNKTFAGVTGTNSNTDIMNSTNNNVFNGQNPVNIGFSNASQTVQPLSALTKTDEKSEGKMQEKPVQQLQILTSGFQPSNHLMLPMAAGQGGGFIIGGAPTIIPSAQNGEADKQTGNVGYQLPIIGYPMQLGGASSIQIAAMPNATFNLPGGFIGFAGGIPAQIMTVHDNLPNSVEPSKSNSIQSIDSSPKDGQGNVRPT